MSIKSALRQRAKRSRRAFFEAIGSDRYSRTGQYDIEKKLSRLFGDQKGTFIEAGANDGLLQSNTYWLERFKGWRGLLVEPVPEVAKLCRRNRPNAKVVNAALVASADVKSIRVAAVGLYGYVTGSLPSAEHEAEHRRRGAQSTGMAPGDEVQDIEVPARTLESILDECQFGQIDLFSLDVEGFEAEVLKGMNPAKYRPRYLLVEAYGPEKLLDVLGGYYEFAEQITPQDVLLRARQDHTT